MSMTESSSVEGNHALLLNNRVLNNRALLRSTSRIGANSKARAANQALPETNNHLLKSNSAMMSAHRDLLAQIATKLGVM